MKRKGSVQPMLIISTILVIGVIIFTLFKFDIIERDSVKEEKPPETVVDEADDEELIEIDEDELIEDEDYYDIAIGKKAPNFTLTNLNGDEVSLEDYEGKIVLINFWATWCGFCRQEMPDIQKLSDESDDLVVLAVDVMEDKDIVEDYINEGGYDFEVLLDETGEVAKTYLVSAFPTTYFVDKDGILLGGVPGMMTGPQMNEIVDNIRKGE